MKPKPDTSSSAVSGIPIAALTMNLRNQIRHYLDLREMSASQLAKKASVPKQSVSGWLAGSNPRDVKQVKRVADVLGVSVDHLLFGNGSDVEAQKVTELDALLGDGWLSGTFELRLRRVKKG